MKRLYILLLIVCGFAVSKARSREPMEAYLFVYFTDNSPEGEQLRFAVSLDGFNYTPLNNGQRIVNLRKVARTGCIRDPHILRAEDGRTFYMVLTDMCSDEGWSSNDGIIMMKSADLVNWKSTSVDFPTAFPQLYTREGLTRVWAPQTIYDREAGKYMVYYSLEIQGGYLSIWYSYADKSFSRLSAPQLLADFGDTVLDADIVENDGHYHMFLSGIWKTTAPSLKGPWNTLERKSLQPTSMAAEGPSAFKLNNSNDWCLMYDCFRNGMYQFCRSSNLEDFQLTAQTEKHGSFTPRHGTVMSITRKELQRLLKAFPSYGLTLQRLQYEAMPDGCRSFITSRNPLFEHEFTADPAPMVIGDTLWLFTGHDVPGKGNYNLPEWSVFSTTDLCHWRQYPTPLKATDLTWNRQHRAYAAHPVCYNGKYYLYVSTDGSGIGVAVSDCPEGPYRDALGKQLIRTEDCIGASHSWVCIDPAVFIDDDQQPWIFWGNGICYYARLKKNMLELDGPVRRVDLRTNGYRYTEAPWIHKFDGRYYLTYATGFPERLAYAVSDSIDGCFETKGLLTEVAGNSNTTHPGIIEFNGQWYLFTHDGTSQNGGSSNCRSVSVYKLFHQDDGTIRKVELDSKGIW